MSATEIEIEIEANITDDLLSSKFEKANYSSITAADRGEHPDDAVHKSSSGKSSVLSVLWNFLNITVGIGILSLPFAMRTTGLVSTVVALIVFAVICTHTLNLLVISAQKISVFNYEGIAEHCYGLCGYYVTSLLIFIMVFGGLITEFIAIGDAAFGIAQLWGYHSAIERQVIMVVISTVAVLPLCLFRDLSKLEHISALKILSVVFIVVVVAYEWCTMDRAMMPSMDMDHLTTLNIRGLPQTLGIISFSFLCHDCVFLMYNTLERPTLSRWKKVSSAGIAGTVALNLAFAIPAFLTFGQESDPNVINNYGVSNMLFIAVRAVIVVIMALSYPPAFFLVRHIVYSASQRTFVSFRSFRHSVRTASMRSIMHHPQDVNTRAIEVANTTVDYSVQHAPLSHHIGFTVVVFFSNLAIALFITNLGAAMAIIGSLSAMNLELVLPALFYIKICIDPKRWSDATVVQKLSLICEQKLHPQLILVIVGALFAITGVLSSLNII